VVGGEQTAGLGDGGFLLHCQNRAAAANHLCKEEEVEVEEVEEEEE